MRLLPVAPLKCSNCGAPLELNRDATETTCRYCGVVFRVERPKVVPPLAQRTPGVVYVRSGGSTPLLMLISLAITVLAGAAAAIANHSASSALSLRSPTLPAPTTAANTASPIIPVQTPEPIVIDAEAVTAKQPARKLTARSPSNGNSARRSTKLPSAVPAVPATPALPGFDDKAADAALGRANQRAMAQCKLPGHGYRAVDVRMGFTPDGRNGNARLPLKKDQDSPEGQCVLAIFRSVTIPPYDPARRGPPGIGYGVAVRY